MNKRRQVFENTFWAIIQLREKETLEKRILENLCVFEPQHLTCKLVMGRFRGIWVALLAIILVQLICFELYLSNKSAYCFSSTGINPKNLIISIHPDNRDTAMPVVWAGSDVFYLQTVVLKTSFILKEI